jgi:hypothetical protein
MFSGARGVVGPPVPPDRTHADKRMIIVLVTTPLTREMPDEFVYFGHGGPSAVVPERRPAAQPEVRRPSTTAR